MPGTKSLSSSEMQAEALLSNPTGLLSVSQTATLLLEADPSLCIAMIDGIRFIAVSTSGVGLAAQTREKNAIANVRANAALLPLVLLLHRRL